MKKLPTPVERELRKAIKNRDTKQIVQLVDFMRFDLRKNYHDCYQAAEKASGISVGEWDELLYETDQSTEDENNE